jgi:uncharacterized protein
VTIVCKRVRRVIRLRVLVCPAALCLLGILSLTGCEKIRSLLHPESKVASNAKVRSFPRSRSEKSDGARLAIILDDLGNDRAAADAVFGLPYHLTISVLPHHPYSADIAQEAHRRGYEVMLHLPMQAQGSERPENEELRPGMAASEVSRELNGMLQAVPYVVGVNNHQGSLATSNPALMSELMPLLRNRDLFFIDSRTTAATVAFDVAEKDSVRCAFRNVPFLDDVQDVAAIRKQLELAFRSAQEKGEAIAIGHPHPETLAAMHEMLPQAQALGVKLVFASELVH